MAPIRRNAPHAQPRSAAGCFLNKMSAKFLLAVSPRLRFGPPRRLPFPPRGWRGFLPVLGWSGFTIIELWDCEADCSESSVAPSQRQPPVPDPLLPSAEPRQTPGIVGKAPCLGSFRGTGRFGHPAH